ncbi:Scr1 family TA system antitoxin-like transcriptional regulator [Streptomyces sp. KLOTTS4A1]
MPGRAARPWQAALIPGLLQTPDYARASAIGNHPATTCR